MNNSLFWYGQTYGETYKRAEETSLSDWYDVLKRHAPVPDDWRPPQYKIRGSGAWPDWMCCWVPLWSERALQILGPLVEASCQFVPWIEEPGHRYWLVNVLTVVPKANWSCEESSVYGGVYASADGIRIIGTAVPPMFRLEGYTGKEFVSDDLARTSVASKLRGALFVHPLIHWAETVFRNPRLGRAGTGFLRPNSDDVTVGWDS